MTTLEELIKQRDSLNEQIATLKQELEDKRMKEMQSKYLNKIVRQFREDYNDLIFLKVEEVDIHNGGTLLGNGVYLEGRTITGIQNESIDLDEEYGTKIVSKEEMIDELTNTVCKYM